MEPYMSTNFMETSFALPHAARACRNGVTLAAYLPMTPSMMGTLGVLGAPGLSRHSFIACTRIPIAAGLISPARWTYAVNTVYLVRMARLGHSVFCNRVAGLQAHLMGPVRWLSHRWQRGATAYNLKLI